MTASIKTPSTPTAAVPPVNDLSSIDHYGDVSQSRGGAYQVGVKARNEGRIVRTIVFVNCHIGDGEKKTLKAIPLHQIPVERKRIHERAGELTIEPMWVPGINRERGLTEAEVHHLKANLIEGFQLQMRDGTPFNCFHYIYGGVNTPCTFASKLSEITATWRKMCSRVRLEQRRVTADDVNWVLDTVFPDERIEADTIDPDFDSSEVEQFSAPIGAAGEMATQVLRDGLVTAGVPQETADAYAATVARLHGDPLAPEDWEAIPGCAKVDKSANKHRRELISLTADIVAGTQE